jgi:hypothetical protein
MRARYADGRTALANDVDVELAADTLTLRGAGLEQSWAYADLARADDDNGRVVLKRRPDTGERLIFEAGAQPALCAAAPALFRPSARGVESRWVVGGVVAAAWTLAAVFLIGTPMAAEPIARLMPAKYRTQISDISWSQVNSATTTCDNSDRAAEILNGLAYRLMTTSHVRQRDDVWITIVHANFPNAFALPDDSIIVTDDLIERAEHPDEIAGVIAHEIAHIEHNHIMKNVIKQMGAGIFFDVVFGGAGAGQVIAIASVNLAGLRFSRDDEADADSRGIDYLEAAGIDPGRLATFFERIERYADKQGAGHIPSMLSSHPASAERAAAARARARSGLAPSLSEADWQIVRHACDGVADGPTIGDAIRQLQQPAPPQPAPEPRQTPETTAPAPAPASKPFLPH